jgi:ferritin-like metal-binding protein YciE
MTQQRLLDETLQEESKTDESLTALADATANAKAQGPQRPDPP